MDQQKTALVLGATGLVGSKLLQLLLHAQQYSHVIAITRKPLADHGKLQQVLLQDFEQMEEYAHLFSGVDDVFCCLGTTIKQAGSQDRFRQVDYAYPLAAARIAEKAGVRRFLLVSAMGANSQSRIFYNRVKGEAEKEICALQLPCVSILRPSLLLGERKQFRFGERLASWILPPLAPIFRGRLFKYRPIQAQAVAAAMLGAAQILTSGTNIYENDQLHRMASRYSNG